jgi:outer membrane protein TolC
MKTAFVSAALLGALVSAPAFAQAPAPAPRPPTPAAPARPTAPGTAPATAPAAPAEPTATPEPQLPTVDDPMLAPAPPPVRVLQSWREAIELARKQSPSLRTSLARIDEASGRARQALAVALPKLSAGAGISRELLRGDVPAGFDALPVPPGTRAPVVPSQQRVGAPDPATDLRARLDLRIPVFAPAAWYNHGTAKDATDLSRLDVKETERQVVRDIADSIVLTVTAERLAEVTRVSLSSALSTVDLNKRRAALGASSQLDVLRAEQLVQDARANVVTADETLRRSREALGAAFGSLDAYGVNPDIQLGTLARDAQTYCRQETKLDSRPDIIAANASVALAERRKEGVDWDFWPTLDAVSQLSVANRDFENGDKLSWTVGGELTWLLFDGGERYGRRDEAAATARIAKEQLNDIRQRANTEVVQAVRAVDVATVNLGVFQRSREIAAETARLARVAYINGSGTSFDLVDTAGRLRQAEIDLTVKEFELLRARVAAFLALASCTV